MEHASHHNAKLGSRKGKPAVDMSMPHEQRKQFFAGRSFGQISAGGSNTISTGDHPELSLTCQSTPETTEHDKIPEAAGDHSQAEQSRAPHGDVL